MLLRPRGRVKHRQFSIERLARTGSTQDVVRRAAAAGAPPGFCCVADEQTAGRGRQDRRWIAPPGTALLASVLLDIPPPVLDGVPIAAGLAVTDAVERVSGVRPQLKWPNDVLFGGRKLAGMLAEVEPRARWPGRTAVAVGLGLNLTVPAFPDGVNGVSLHELVSEPPSRDRVLTAWLEALDDRIAALQARGAAGLLEDWRARAAGLGEPVTIVSAARTFDGIAEDIDADGCLLVRTPDGVERVMAGDVHLVTGPR